MKVRFNVLVRLIIMPLICTALTCMADTPSGWSISAGWRYRPADYELSTELLENWEEFVVPLEGEGSLELYDGVGHIEYQDGWISDVSHRHRSGDGTAYSGRYSDKVGEHRIWPPWHSTAYGLPRIAESVHSYSTDSKSSSPFIKASLVCGRAFGGRLNFCGNYSFAKEHKEHTRQIGHQQIVQDETMYRFLYDIEEHAGFFYPIYDPVLWGHAGTTPGYPRREIASQQDVVITEFTAIMDSDLRYDLHEFTLGVEWARRIGNRFDLFVAVGPTINILDWTFSHETSWSATGYADPVAVSTGRESDTDVVVGGMAEIGGRVDLTDDGRYFCEFSGRYEYLKTFDLVAGTGRAEVDLKGYTGAIGFGVAL